MKLGYGLRKNFIVIENQIKRAFSLCLFLSWLLFDPSKFKKIKPEKIKSLLVVNMGKTVGDFYLLLGMLNKLNKNYPRVRIYMLCLDKNKKFVKNPNIKVLSLSEAKNLIKKKKIDSLINYTVFLKNMHYTKIPYRMGLDEVNIKEVFRKWQMPATRRIFPYNKGIIRMFLSFEKLGFYLNRELYFYFTKESEKYAEEFYKKYKKGKEKIIFIHPGSGKGARSSQEKGISSASWPSERWAKVADSLIKRYNSKIVFTGVENEKPIIQEIISKIKNKKKALDAPSNLSVEEEASLLKRGDLLVTIDTATAHIGAQAGIPLIDLFGPYQPIIAMPWTDKKSILFHSEVCSGCKKNICPEGFPQCMESITVKEVLRAASNYLK